LGRPSTADVDLHGLGPAEHAAWAALWADVDGLLRDAAFPADPFRR
jgi:hypothetical protein